MKLFASRSLLLTCKGSVGSLGKKQLMIDKKQLQYENAIGILVTIGVDCIDDGLL